MKTYLLVYPWCLVRPVQVGTDGNWLGMVHKDRFWSFPQVSNGKKVLDPLRLTIGEWGEEEQKWNIPYRMFRLCGRINFAPQAAHPGKPYALLMDLMQSEVEVLDWILHYEEKKTWWKKTLDRLGRMLRPWR